MKKRNLFIHFVILLVIILSDHLFHWDFFIQKKFLTIIDGQTQWWIDANSYWPKLIFYKGIKCCLFLFGFYLIGKSIYGWRTKKDWPYRDYLQIILALIVIPSFVSFLKSSTHMYCPKELTLFGGQNAFIPLFEFLPKQAEYGRCFPAGHASGGLALIALGYTDFFKNRKWGIGIGLLIGHIMGAYQMMKGDHFLSHTLVSQQIAFIFNEIIYVATLNFKQLKRLSYLRSNV